MNYLLWFFYWSLLCPVILYLACLLKRIFSGNTEHMGCHMCLFTRDAVTKCHRLGGLNNRNLFPHNSGDQKSIIKVLAGLVSSEISLLGS